MNNRGFMIIGIVLLAVVVTGFLTSSFRDGGAVATLIGAWMTLFIYSFLYGDNPVYKFAEHLYVGVAAGYGAAVVFWDSWLPKWFEPLFFQGEWSLIIPGALGFLFFFRFVPNKEFMIRWPLAFLVGGFAGAKLTGEAQGNLVIQAGNTMTSLSDAATTGEFVTAILIAVGVITTLTYFFFSKPHTGLLGGTARVGIIFLMVAFGASFGYTVMGRISLLIGRLYFLFSDWLRLID